MSCQCEPNLEPFILGAPIFQASVPHGQKYILDYQNTSINLAIVNGTSYEVGFAVGQLFAKRLRPIWIT
jgi:hypothetical protein